jgi:hypothetical protein
MQESSVQYKPKKALNYFHLQNRVRPVLSFVVIIVIAVAGYFLGFEKGKNSKNTVVNTESPVVENITNETVSPTNTDSIPIKAGPQVERISKTLGTFNNEIYVLAWDETWPVDSSGNLIKSGEKPLSFTPAVLEKYPPLNLDAKPEIVGKNIVFAEEYATVENVISATPDYEAVILDLRCKNCNNEQLILNLKSARVLKISSLTASFAARVKQEGSCSLIPFNNFIQANLLYTCIDPEKKETLYKYHISTLAPKSIEILKEIETFSCGPDSTNIFSAIYTDDQFVIDVCELNPQENSADTKIREIKVKDI